MNENMIIEKANLQDVKDMKPMIHSAFESSLMDGLGYVEQSMLPDEGLEDMLMMDGITVYKAVVNDQLTGGAIVRENSTERHNILELLFVNPEQHSNGAGLRIWEELEKLYPDTEVWETETPEFSKRNIHFYVNKCGFHIVEYFNEHHPYRSISDENAQEEVPCGMFLFKKYMKALPD